MDGWGIINFLLVLPLVIIYFPFLKRLKYNKKFIFHMCHIYLNLCIKNNIPKNRWFNGIFLHKITYVILKKFYFLNVVNVVIFAFLLIIIKCI
jgi:hypothetical protein